MNPRTVTSVLALAGILAASAVSTAQVPARPPATSTLAQKDQLLEQARQAVTDLTSLKNNGALSPEQAAEVDELLPVAAALSSELDKPQADAASLRELSSDLAEMQKQVSALKRLAR